MSGKGSGRRPQQADDAEVAARWAAIFGKQETNDQTDGTEPPKQEQDNGG